MESRHNLTYECGGFIERSNAWYISERPVTGKDYFDGQAYLEWVFRFVAVGRWHKALFVTKKEYSILDGDLGSICATDVPKSEISGSGDRQHSPVFVDQIELMEIDQGVRSSWIWFQVTDDVLGRFTGFPGFVFQPLLEVEPVGRCGERGVVWGFPHGDSAGRDQIVERCPKIVNGIADGARNLRWQALRERYVEPILARTKVRFLPNAVRVLTEVAEDEVIHLSDVRLRALQLQVVSQFEFSRLR